MKHLTTIVVALAMAMMAWMGTSCSVSQAVQMKNCEYKYSHVSDVTIMNMTPQELKSVGGASVFTQLILGKIDRFTVGCTIHVKVHNPNDQMASVDQLYYAIMVDSIQIAEGCNKEEFVVPGHTSNDMPLKLNVDLRTIVNKQSRASMFNLVKNLIKLGDEPSHITVLLKPVVRVAGVPLSVPKSIPLRFEIGSSSE